MTTFTISSAERVIATRAKDALESAPPAPRRPRLFGGSFNNDLDQIRRRKAFLHGCLAEIVEWMVDEYHSGRALELHQPLLDMIGTCGSHEAEYVVPQDRKYIQQRVHNLDAEGLLEAMAGMRDHCHASGDETE